MINRQELEEFVETLDNLNTDGKRAEHEETQEEYETRLIDWITFYRRNIDIFVTDYLGIRPLAYLQRQMLLTMADNDFTCCICSREMGKSHVTALFGIVMCLLYPSYKVVITAKTVDQAEKIITKKIQDIFCKENATWSSPILVQMVKDGYIKFGQNDKTKAAKVEFGNGSWIEARACIESSRGDRANLVIADEVALLPKTLYQRIIHPVLETRTVYTDIYKTNAVQMEGKEIFLTSARNKTNWIYKEMCKAISNHFKNKSYGFFLGDIYTAVANGINSINQLLKAKELEEYTWEQEYLNIWLGSDEHSLYKYEQFNKLQNLHNAFLPRTIEDILSQNDNPTVKLKDNEIRVMSLDVAVAVGQDNDNSAILCGRFNIDSRTLEVDYARTLNGMNSTQQAYYIKRLFYDYKADYLTMDVGGVGAPLYDLMTKETIDEETGELYPAWTISRERDLQIVSDKVYTDKVQRTIDKNAKPVLIPIVGTRELNTNIHLKFRESLNSNRIFFLIDSDDRSGELEIEDTKWLLKTSDERAEILLPYLVTRHMINESVGLNCERQGANIKVIENSNATKDLYMSVAYLNYFVFEKLALRYAKRQVNNQKNTGFNIDDWNMLAMVNQ